MLILTLACRDALSAKRHTLRGLIASTGVGERSDYWVSLFDERSRPCSRGVLHQYPMWVEPMSEVAPEIRSS